MLGAHWEEHSSLSCSLIPALLDHTASQCLIWENSVPVMDFTSEWGPRKGVRTKPPPTAWLLWRQEGWPVVRKQKRGPHPRERWGTAQSKPTTVHWGMKAVCLCGKPAERHFSNIFQDLRFLGFFSKSYTRKCYTEALLQQLLHKSCVSFPW